MEAYLDYNATSPLDPEVRKTMIESFASLYANPSSFHQKGQKVRHAVEAVRELLAQEIGSEPGDIVFTSGGTEANNLALKGVMAVQAERGRKKLIISAVEHQAVLHPAKFLESNGFSLTVIPVDEKGLIRLELLEKAMDSQTALVSVMHANNEVGTFQPVQAIAALAHVHGAYFHTDAVQTFGKMPLDVETLGADLATFSAHKLCGPKGVGALFVKKGVKLKALFHGGHQEKNIRPGTENSLGIFGFGKAIEQAQKLRGTEMLRVRHLRDALEAAILKSISGVRVNGDPENRLHNTTSLSFEGLDGETFLMNLDLKNIYVSTGSACTAGSVEPSHVLLALGLSESSARGTIRFSLGRFTSPEEVDYAIRVLPEVVERLRKNSSQAHRKRSP